MSATLTRAPESAVPADLAKLLSIYTQFADHFGLEPAPAHDASAAARALPQVEQWMDRLDQSVQTYQLRLLTQSSALGDSSEKIRVLLGRYLDKRVKSAADRGKIDFLLAHYFGAQAPKEFHTREVSLADVAEVLLPIIGRVPRSELEQNPKLEDLVTALAESKSLEELKERAIMDRARSFKAGLGNEYLLPANLVACTRLNYLLRRRCSELMKSDLAAIEADLDQLAMMGEECVDCTAANLSAIEPISSVKEICQRWQAPRVSEYGTETPYAQVLALKKAVTRAVRKAESAARGSAEESGVMNTNSEAKSAGASEDGSGPVMDTAAVRRMLEAAWEQKASQLQATLVSAEARQAELAEKVRTLESEIEVLKAELELRPEIPNLPLGTTDAALEQLGKAVQTTAVEKASVEDHSAENTSAINGSAGSPAIEDASAGHDLDAQEPAESASKKPANGFNPSPQLPEPVRRSLDLCIKQIEAGLAHLEKSKPSIGPINLTFGTLPVPLSAPEVKAFLEPDIPFSSLIRDAAAAKTYILYAATQKAKDKGQNLASAVGAAQTLANTIESWLNAASGGDATMLAQVRSELSSVVQQNHS
ncbi:MAG TPA: hypothetical protein VEG30_15830 [Terriglobales bacterium]|nr:hypothetical protein [Terriglobales bacterium]